MNQFEHIFTQIRSISTLKSKFAITRKSRSDTIPIVSFNYVPFLLHMYFTPIFRQLSMAKGLTKDKELKSSPQRKKKKKAKMKNVKRSTDNEFKDLAEPDETQVNFTKKQTNKRKFILKFCINFHSIQTSQMSNCNETCATSQTSEDSLANPNESSAADENVTDPYPLDEEVVKQLQRELNPEILDNEFDPKVCGVCS